MFSENVHPQCYVLRASADELFYRTIGHWRRSFACRSLSSYTKKARAGFPAIHAADRRREGPDRMMLICNRPIGCWPDAMELPWRSDTAQTCTADVGNSQICFHTKLIYDLSLLPNSSGRLLFCYAISRAGIRKRNHPPWAIC